MSLVGLNEAKQREETKWLLCVGKYCHLSAIPCQHRYYYYPCCEQEETKTEKI